MTKLEELKAALEAAAQGEWDYVVSESAETPSSFVVDEDGEHILRHRYGVTRKAQRDVEFVTLAHNLMPTLLEAVDLLETLRYSMSQYDDGDWFLHEGGEDVVGKVDEFLEKLK